MSNKPWGIMNPNTQHQLWSKWVFTVSENGKHPLFKDVFKNVYRWIRKGFGTTGEVRVKEKIHNWEIELIVEGAPAQDPEYVENVRKQFVNTFIKKGWGFGAFGDVDVSIIAGDAQDGKPLAQTVVMPSRIEEESRVWS